MLRQIANPCSDAEAPRTGKLGVPNLGEGWKGGGGELAHGGLAVGAFAHFPGSFLG